MSVNPARFYTRLKDVTRAYGQALDRYTQAMRTGDTDRADEAFSRMQEIEQGVTMIVSPGLQL